MFFIAFENKVGVWSMCVSVCICGRRQGVISFRSGLYSIVSSVGARERIVTIWIVASLVEVGVVIEEAGGRGVVFESERRCRNNMALLRSVIMSCLTVLGHSILHCL
jgi:hypothetical protein